MNSGYSAAEHRRGSLPNRARQEMEGPQNGQDQVAAMRQRLEGTNVSPKTFLATDYLNHFNEIVMILGLCGDDPTMIEELGLWEPKSYEEHFLGSGLSYGQLAADAYALAPAHVRAPFDGVIELLTWATQTACCRLAGLRPDDAAEVAAIIESTLPLLKDLVEIAGAIINGTTVPDANQISRLRDLCGAIIGDLCELAVPA